MDNTEQSYSTPHGVATEEPEQDIGTSLMPEPTLSGGHAGTTPPAPVQPGGLSPFVWLAVFIVCLVVAWFIFAGIRARSSAEKKLTTTTNQAAIPAVRTTRAATTTGAGAEIILPATVAAYVDTPIYARTSGYLKKWYFDIGSHVPQGALLAVIETPELDQQVQQAEADVKTAQSNLELAQITSARWDKLLQKNAVSHQEADQATSDLAARRSTLSAQQANLHRLQQMQSYEKIYAPFAGVITARNVDTGALIQAEQNTTNKELFHLASTGRLRVFVPVPEVSQGVVHDGERVVITTDAFPNEKFHGTVARNSRSVDTMSRTLNVEVDIDNTTGKLLPGAYAFVHFPVTEAQGGLRVPSNTLLFRAQGMQVAVVQNGVVSLRDVKIGHDYGATVEIVSGLGPEDEVVLDPADSIESGDRVRVAPAAPTGAGE